MKKIFYILLIVLLIFAVGCRPAEPEEDLQPAPEEPAPEEPAPEEPAPEEEEPAEAKYKDGTYEGEGDPWEYGSENATVVISEGKISEITLRRLDKEGNEVNYDDWTGQEIEGKTYPNLKQYRVDLANEMIEKQSYEVDSISGATVSSDNWKLAVQRALDKAQE